MVKALASAYISRFILLDIVNQCQKEPMNASKSQRVQDIPGVLLLISLHIPEWQCHLSKELINTKEVSMINNQCYLCSVTLCWNTPEIFSFFLNDFNSITHSSHCSFHSTSSPDFTFTEVWNFSLPSAMQTNASFVPDNYWVQSQLLLDDLVYHSSPLCSTLWHSSLKI